jgi:hypothetical protein
MPKSRDAIGKTKLLEEMKAGEAGLLHDTNL